MNHRLTVTASVFAVVNPRRIQPMKSFCFFFRVLPAVLLLFLLVGCDKSTRISTAAAGHKINAVITGAHSIDTHDDHGVITSPYGTVTIESTRIRLDGGSWTTIPAKSLVEIRISRGKVLLAAGNVSVKRTQN